MCGLSEANLRGATIQLASSSSIANFPLGIHTEYRIVWVPVCDNTFGEYPEAVLRLVQRAVEWAIIQPIASANAKVTSTPVLKYTAQRCGASTWLGTQNTAVDCMARILGQATGCSHQFFYWAARGDKNCGCALQDTLCDTTIWHDVVDTYEIIQEDSDLELAGGQALKTEDDEAPGGAVATFSLMVVLTIAMVAVLVILTCMIMRINQNEHQAEKRIEGMLQKLANNEIRAEKQIKGMLKGMKANLDKWDEEEGYAQDEEAQDEESLAPLLPGSSEMPEEIELVPIGNIKAPNLDSELERKSSV